MHKKAFSPAPSNCLNAKRIRLTLMNSSKVDFTPICHSVLDTESSEFGCLWIPAFAGMTVFGLLTRASTLNLAKLIF